MRPPGASIARAMSAAGVWNPKAILVMTLVFYVWVTGPGLLILTASATSLRLLFS